MIRLHITMTGKSFSPKAKYECFAEDYKVFPNRKAANAWLKEQYGSASKTSCYLDVDGQVQKVGYVYGFRNADLSHYPVDKWLQRDWVEFQELTPTSP